MKKFLLFFLIFFIGFILVNSTDLGKSAFDRLNQFFYQSVCDNPIYYKIGYIDKKFDLSENQFHSYIQQASELWNQAEGKNLFAYNPEAKLSINLVFDDRQLLRTKIVDLQNKLKAGEISIEEKEAEYDRLAANFRQRIASLNEQIAYWNQRGGAPPEEYEKLKKEQEELEKQAKELNALARMLNTSADQFNTQVGTLNQTIDTFNQALSVKPEQGVYSPQENKIDIYFSTSQNEIIHTLAHELGHALGLEHIQNKNAIMYPFTTEEITFSADDLAALKKICERQSLFEIFAKNSVVLFEQLTARIKEITF